jgi:hypothetical protein
VLSCFLLLLPVFELVEIVLILNHNTQPQHTLRNAKNTNTMISSARRLPAASIF